MSPQDQSKAPHNWDVSHICLVVNDLDEWTERYTTLLGTQWSSAVVIDQEWELPDGSLKQMNGRGVWASGQKPWLELFEGPEGSPWYIEPGQARLDHIGYWADDLNASARLLEEAGHELEYKIPTGSKDIVGFAYYRHPRGIRVEIHEGGDREAFRLWVDEGQPLVVNWGVEAP